ncbi:MAG: mucoidy inhibitor MuiA family protein [Candidatus Eremiobacteraeota bacterium]|nr:mucoidy inhibitor MuiA family protein [Candidatus Eremiobacteraeota bacterium]
MTMELAKLPRAGLPENRTAVDAPVTDVTITEDQADVARKIPVTWEKGMHHFFITPVTPYLVDSTLWAEVLPSADMPSPHIGSARVVRWSLADIPLTGEDETTFRGLLATLGEKINELSERKARLALLRGSLARGLPPAAQSVIEEVVASGAEPESYQELLGRVLATLESLSREEQAIVSLGMGYEKELISLRRDWLEKTSQELHVTWLAGILVTIEAKEGGQGTLRCGYQVPCAQWRPQHEAHLISESRVLLVTNAVVWQNTGEDWNGVTLTLSTAKPSAGMDALLPREDIVKLREKTKEERSRIKVETRDQAIQTTGVGAAEAEEPPLPADGGETQLYRIGEKVTVPATGRPCYIRISGQEMDGQAALMATPELDSHVFLVSQVKNASERPLLAGPVTLHRMGAYVGTGQLEFTGSNEMFHLWWGSEDLIRIERFADRKEEEATLIAPRKITTTITLLVRNLSGDPQEFTIRERVPVSELEQIRVKIREMPPEATAPDSNGFLAIHASVGPREEKKYRVSFLMEVDKEVDFAGL